MVNAVVLTLELLTFVVYTFTEVISVTITLAFNFTEPLFTDILDVPVKVDCFPSSAVCNPLILDMDKVLFGMVNVFVLTLEVLTCFVTIVEELS